MSMSHVKGYTTHVPEEGWRFDCDHTGCDRHITIHADGHVFDGAAGGEDHLVCGFDDAMTAFDLGATHYGWTRDTRLHPRCHCPEHSREARS